MKFKLGIIRGRFTINPVGKSWECIKRMCTSGKYITCTVEWVYIYMRLCVYIHIYTYVHVQYVCMYMCAWQILPLPPPPPNHHCYIHTLPSLLPYRLNHFPPPFPSSYLSKLHFLFLISIPSLSEIKSDKRKEKIGVIFHP